MKLNAEQQAMAEGKYGEGVALAIKVQIGIGECFNAPYMVPITRSHVALSNQESDLWFAEKMVRLGAKTRVQPTVNPGFCLSYFQSKHMVEPEDAAHMQRTHEAHKTLGCRLTYSCTPYMETNIPLPGELLAFSESSATPYVNAVWAARSNRESAQSALCASITGYVPYYGLLLDENRKGTVLVDVQAKMNNDHAWNMLGYMGKKIGPGVPVFTGIEGYVSKEAHRNLCAELNTSAAYGMYHIVGVTPEAPSVEAAFGGKPPERTVVITDTDLEEVLEREISDPGNRPIDFALFGCPHSSVDEVQYITRLVAGKQLAVPLLIMTSALTRVTVEKMGLLDILREAGGDVVEDSCMDQPCFHVYRGKCGITDSPKLAYYPRKRGLEFVVRDLETCVHAALEGVVK